MSIIYTSAPLPDGPSAQETLAALGVQAQEVTRLTAELATAKEAADQAKYFRDLAASHSLELMEQIERATAELAEARKLCGEAGYHIDWQYPFADRLVARLRAAEKGAK